MSSLGLLMQLGGTLGMITASVIALGGTFVVGLPMPGILFAIGALCWIRAAHHRAAGTALLYRPETVAPAIARYALVSLAQTGFCLFLLRDALGPAVLVQLGAASLAWPVVLAARFVVHQPTAMPGGARSEDLGFEGVSVLMVALGLTGALFAATFVALFVADLSITLKSTAMTGSALILVVLLVRSLIHVRAGLEGIAGASFDQHIALGRRYHDAGTGSAACVGAAVFVISLLGTHAAQLWVALASGTAVGLALFAWPSLLRRFYMERNFEVYLVASQNGHDQPSFQRPPDAGLTALGWLLVAASAPALALSVVAISVTGLSGTPGICGALDIETHALWWLLSLALPGSWAGVELVRMSPRRKLAAMVFAGVAGAMMIAPLGPDLGGPWAIFELTGQGAEASLTALRATLIYLLTVLAMATAIIAGRRSLPAAFVRVARSARVAGRQPARPLKR